MRRFILNARRIVIKIGTSILAPGAHLEHKRIKELVEQVATLTKKLGMEIILVSSGAIGAGMGILKFKERPKNLPQQQACASVGQSHLMDAYDGFFKPHGLRIGQILLTRDDMEDRRRYLNARNTILTLLKYNSIPIVNENDTVSVDEIRFGDNDLLSALVSNMVNADLLIILSDVDGLYIRQKSKIDVVKRITPEIERIAEGTTKVSSMGGMSTKIEAAKIVMRSGIPLIIADGTVKDILIRVIRGEKIGTLFVPSRDRISARKRWLAFTSNVKGFLLIDEGAKNALLREHRSLLSSGIVKVGGNFKEGDLISIMDKAKREIGRGLTNYSSDDIGKIKGLRTSRIENVLGWKNYDEVIHRDNMVIL